MALFLGVHEGGELLSEDDVKTSWDRYKNACGNHNCRPLRSHYNAEQGRAFCVTEAESAQNVEAAHQEAEVPLKEVIAVKIIE